MPVRDDVVLRFRVCHRFEPGRLRKRITCHETTTAEDDRSARINASEHRRRGGVPVPTALHTAWELARTLPMLTAVPWIDALAHVQEIKNERLREHALLHAGEVGCWRAAETLALCDGRAESRPESIVRVHLVLAGIPAPIPQWRVVVDHRFIARVDLAWPDLKLAVEYDGEWHASNAALSRDRQRLRDLNAAGWLVYPVTRHDFRNLPVLVRTIGDIVASRSSVA